MKKLENKYNEYEKQNLIRKLYNFCNDTNNIDFITNDYLNLSNSSNLKEFLINGFNEYGFGSKGSNLTCGYTDETQQFEIDFAKFTNYPQAIFFSSGFMANLAI